MSIVKAKNYVPVLDAKLKQRVKTSVFDSTGKYEYVAKANTFLVATRDYEGLADYSRANGYDKSGVDVDWESYTVNYDRGKMLIVDERDNEEAAGMAFLNLAGDLVLKVKEYTVLTMQALLALKLLAQQSQVLLNLLLQFVQVSFIHRINTMTLAKAIF